MINTHDKKKINVAQLPRATIQKWEADKEIYIHTRKHTPFICTVLKF